MEITFETLPNAVNQLNEKLNNIERLLLEKSNPPLPETNQWFDLNELINYLPDKPAKATIYGWAHSNLIPYHKGQKKLRFLKSEIDDWMKQGRRKTLSEIAHEAEQYLTKKKGGNNG